MRIASVVMCEDGGSRFVDVEVEQPEAPFAENVPPLLVSTPVPAEHVVFVTTPSDLVGDTRPHPAPRRQWIIVLDGELEVETTDGERRAFPPGGVVLVKDVSGRGHVAAFKGPTSWVAVPLSA